MNHSGRSWSRLRSTDEAWGSTDEARGSTDEAWGSTDEAWGSTDEAWGSTDEAWGSTDEARCSTSEAVRMTRSTPSPPMPARRSHRARTRSAGRSRWTDPSWSG